MPLDNHLDNRRRRRLRSPSLLADRLAPAMLALLAAVPAWGEEAPMPAGTERAAELPVVEVIAVRRQAGPLDPAVVTAGQLESAGRQDLARGLDLLPGVTINRIGARNEALVKVRGYDSRQVPLYIDGIPVYVPYDGNIDLSRLATGDVESIRLTRGGGSVLYGPNALGGTINVVTRRPRPGFTAGTRLGQTLDDRGDAARTDLGGRLGYAGERWYVQAAASLLKTDFFRLPDGDFGPAEDGGRRENSAAKDLSTGIKVGWMGGSGAEWQLAWSRLDGEKQTPPYAGPPPPAGVNPRFWRWPAYDKQDFYLLGAVPLGERTWVRTRLFHDTFENSLLSFDDATYTIQDRPFAFTSRYDDYSYGGSLELEASPGGFPGTIRAVLHFKQDVHREVDDTAEPRERMEDQTWALALEQEYRLDDAWTLTGGIGYSVLNAQRADDNVDGDLEPFPLEDGSAVNLQAGVAWAVTPGWTLGLNVTRKTRFPTLKDRYSYRLGSALPNPGLADERADQVELSADGEVGGYRLSAALFGSWLDDAIVAVSLPADACDSPPCSQLRNIGRQRNRGGELAVARTLPVVGDLALAWSWVDVDNLSQDLLLTWTPSHKLRVSSRTPLGSRVRLDVDFKTEDGRYSTTNGSRSTAGFGVLDLGLQVRLGAGIRLLVEGSNLTDRLYAYDEGFPEPGRTYSATVLWQLGETP